jgi:hypothetical protein
MKPFHTLTIKEAITADGGVCHQVGGPEAGSTAEVVALTPAELVRVVLAKIDIRVSPEHCETLLATAARPCNACGEVEITGLDDLCEECLSELGA